MEQSEFDFPGTFGDDYLYFYEQLLTPERSDAEAGFVWTLLEITEGMDVLDLACGHGRIANRLAERGARVVGLDATRSFLDAARADATQRGVAVEYVHGDMRAIPWVERFDRIVNWFTAFGYFDDEGNREVLRSALAALKPGGRLLIEMGNRDAVLRNFAKDLVLEREGNFLVDRHAFDAQTGRVSAERIIIRDGEVRRTRYFVRSFTFPELRDWLLDAGFSRVDGYGKEGEPFSLDSRRMIVVATK